MENVFKTTDKWNRFNEKGHEELNPTAMQPPLGYVRQPSLSEQIRQQIATMRRLEDNEPETEEEADDFEISDDPPDPESRWENDNIPTLKETRARLRELEKQEQALTTIAPTGAPMAPPPFKFSFTSCGPPARLRLHLIARRPSSELGAAGDRSEPCTALAPGIVGHSDSLLRGSPEEPARAPNPQQ